MATTFANYLSTNGFIGYGMLAQITLDGRGKKQYVQPKGWNTITKSNVSKNHKSFFVLTGKLSNMTAIDFDTLHAYDSFCDAFPDFKTRGHKVRTKKGYHGLFQYCAEIGNGTNCTQGIDFRNDGCMLISPPSSYKLADGTTFTYTDIPGEHLPITDEMFAWFEDNNLSYKKAVRVSLTGTEALTDEALIYEYNRFSYMMDNGLFAGLSIHSYMAWFSIPGIGSAFSKTFTAVVRQVQPVV